jgi:gamma-glutamyltranspeptidase / glutathione hydrolase
MHPKTLPLQHGGIAAGHPDTSAAGAAMYRQGGNAIDAAVAACFAATVNEPLLTSIAGGGHFMVHDAASGETIAYDAFAALPGSFTPAGEAPIDFRGLEVSFGATTQVFHVGLGSVAVPGQLAGLCAVHAKHGRLPLRTVLEPAIALAKNGATIHGGTQRVFKLLFPIIQTTPELSAMLTPGGELPPEGARYRNPDLAATYELLAEQGPAYFSQGELADELTGLMRRRGGLLRHEDLSDFEVIPRAPLRVPVLGHEVCLTPPISSGGLIIALGLKLIDRYPEAFAQHGVAKPLAFMALFDTLIRARAEDVHFPDGAQVFHRAVYRTDVADHVLDDRHLNRYAHVFEHALKNGVAVPAPPEPAPKGNTTHITAVDALGNACCVTTSVGESCGVIWPGRGVILNNFLGEDDICPEGFLVAPLPVAGGAKRDVRRMSSAMCPTLVFKGGQLAYALGTGGSKRIRWDDGQLSVETFGRPAAETEALRRTPYDVREFDSHGMFFGGVHTIVATSPTTHAGNTGHTAGEKPTGDGAGLAIGGRGDDRRGGVFVGV